MKAKALYRIFLVLVMLAMTLPVAGETRAQTSCPSSYYIVRSGDNLFRIATGNGLTITELQAWNSISDPRLIRVGQIICLTPPNGVPTVRNNGSFATPSAVTLPYPTQSAAPLPTAVPLIGFDSSNPEVKNPASRDPQHRGVWDPMHTLILLVSMFLVMYNIIMRARGESKRDLVGAGAALLFTALLLFWETPGGLGYTFSFYLLMLVFSLVGDRDFSNLGLFCLLVAIGGSFVGQFNLLHISEGIGLVAIPEIANLWSTLSFDELVLSVFIYGNLFAAFLIFSWEIPAEWRDATRQAAPTEIDEKGVEEGEEGEDEDEDEQLKASRLKFSPKVNARVPLRWEFWGDVANALFTVSLILLWGFT